MDADEFCAGNAAPALDLLARFDSIFDVLRPGAQAPSLPDSEIEALIAERDRARKARNFAQADQIRAQLHGRGIILEDTKDGVRWKRK
jgi:cysteinyl-tRNA synthetase